jgi:DNA polymerase-1
MPRKLLIDGDVVAFQCAASREQAIEWEEGYWTWNVSFTEVTNAIINTVERIADTLEGEPVLCLTDPDRNFRKGILPSYKLHRATQKKPLVLLSAKHWMVDELGAVMRPGLEGDDVMGILGTRTSKDEQIIVSIDKDMKTIPGPYVRTRAVTNSDGIELVGAYDVVQITEAEADYNHLFQTLTGDITDGYSGCPGIGPKKAEGIIELGATIADNWQAVVAAFKKAGLGEEEALRQARVARILRASDYDFKKKEPILWTPR